MPTAEVSLSDKTENEITHLVEQGEFLNRERAIEELLTMGISAYDTGDSTEEEAVDDVFTRSRTDRRDPAVDDGGAGDEYPF